MVLKCHRKEGDVPFVCFCLFFVCFVVVVVVVVVVLTVFISFWEDAPMYQILFGTSFEAWIGLTLVKCLVRLRLDLVPALFIVVLMFTASYIGADSAEL